MLAVGMGVAGCVLSAIERSGLHESVYEYFSDDDISNEGLHLENLCDNKRQVLGFTILGAITGGVAILAKSAVLAYGALPVALLAFSVSAVVMAQILHTSSAGSKNEHYDYCGRFIAYGPLAFLAASCFLSGGALPFVASTAQAIAYGAGITSAITITASAGVSFAVARPVLAQRLLNWIDSE